MKVHVASNGFRAVDAHGLSVPLRLESARNAVRYLGETHPTLDEMLTPLSAKEREELWHKIEQALAVFESKERFESPNEVVVVARERASEPP
jgi:hypothetical protein